MIRHSLTNSDDYTRYQIAREAIEDSRDIADGDESVYTRPINHDSDDDLRSLFSFGIK
jgi:hypothetical protein